MTRKSVCVGLVKGSAVAAIAAFGIAMAAPATAQAPPNEVRFCGEQISGEGILLGDLDCTDSQFDSVPAVIIRHLGRLDLNGFSITKGRGKQAVECIGKCEVMNGTIDVLTRGRAAVSGRKRVTVTNVIIEGGWARGVRSNRGVRVVDSIVRQARQIGVRSNKRSVIIRNSEITGNGLLGRTVGGIGVQAQQNAKISDSFVTGNFRFGVLVENGRVILENTVLEENNLQLGCDTPEFDCRGTCDDDELTCFAGCDGDTDCLDDCRDLTELCKADCLECADIATLYRPDFSGSTCDYSLRLFAGVPIGTFPDQNWGVCECDDGICTAEND